MPLYGGEYENCFSDDLAQQRAERELWLHTNMNNTITLTCVPVYWIDVNILCTHKPRESEIAYPYIIKSINIGLTPSDSMTITMIRFYPELQGE